MWSIIAWLHRIGITPKIELIPVKRSDRKCSQDYFLKAFDERRESLFSDSKKAVEFNQEMGRFLSQEQLSQRVKHANFKQFMIQLVAVLEIEIRSSILQGSSFWFCKVQLFNNPEYQVRMSKNFFTSITIGVKILPGNFS